jgi:hypothetical protein
MAENKGWEGVLGNIMAGAIAGMIIGGVSLGLSATQFGMQQANNHKASANALIAQQADAAARAQEQQEAQGQEMVGVLTSMINPTDAHGDPTMNQYLQEAGYMAPGGSQGTSSPGEPSNPPDPSTPRQQIRGGGSFSGTPV